MIIERNGDVSLFKQLKNSLVKQIEEGNYVAGDMLPSEVELIQSYSVSRTTVRRAIQALVHDGIAYTVHGKGTFVAEPGMTQYLNNLTSFSHGVTERGMTPGQKILAFDPIRPTKYLASKLRISPSSILLFVDRLLLADGEPLSRGKTYLSLASIAPYQNEFTLEAFEDKGMYSLLESIGIRLRSGEQVVSAVVADQEMAELLNVPAGAPLLYSERLSKSDGNVPIEYTEMWLRGDKTRWRIALGPYISGE